MSARRAGLVLKIAVPALATTVAASIVLGLFGLREASEHARAQFERAATRTASAVEAAYETHGEDPAATQAFLQAADQHDTDLVAIDLVQPGDAGATIVASSDPADVGLSVPGASLSELGADRGRQVETTDSGQSVLQTTVRFTGVDPPTYAIVSMSIRELEEATHRLRISIFAVVAGAIAVQLLVIGWLILRIVIRPLHRLERTAVEVAGGRLEARVPPRRTILHDEIDSVQSQFNNTIAALDDSFKRQRLDAEQLARLNAEKDTILDAVSHDLRSPLTVVIGAANTLDRPTIDDAMRADLIEGIRQSGQRMLRLVTNLLDLSRLDRGLAGPDRSEVDVRELLSRVVADSRRESGREISLDCPPDLRALVDPVQVERIVDNLVLNAVKHTEPPARIDVRADPEPGGLLLSVSDSGPGVPDELKAAIFEAFRTGGSSPGIGVGLSLVARFAEEHGGSAWVEDAPGGGALFKVRLAAPPPANEVDLERPAASRQAADVG